MIKRKSNMELLRIVSIFFIVVFHCSFKSGITFSSPLDSGEYIIKMFWMLGELGVNLFVLISGYFMINAKFKWKKVILLILKVTLYNAALTLVAVKLGLMQLSGLKQIFLTFFPLTMNRYWFFTAYIVLYILSPYINILAHAMEKTTYKRFLITVLMLYSIIPTVFGIFYNNTETLLYYNRLIWLIVVYFLGAYVRLHSLSLIKTAKRSALTTLISLSVIALSVFVIDRFLPFFSQIGTKEPAYFWPPNTVPMLLLSLGIFGLFEKINLPYNRFVNTLASTTLGVYLLHDGALVYYIWRTIFKAAEQQNSLYAAAYILVAAFIVLIVSMVIDLIYGLIEKYIFAKILELEVFSRKRKGC